ncbi:hypothetical protein [Zavarzinia sp. CC-PAN008]|uniref:hypothetical protein n=1 Tax=Zavarzinia sp. CC-PAN008 TaxID=3243332 RepID=UPI003F742D8F
MTDIADAQAGTVHRQHQALIASLRETVALTQARLHAHLGQDGPPAAFGRDSIATMLRTLVRSTDILIARERSLLKLDGQGSDLGTEDADGYDARLEQSLDRVSAKAVAQGFPGRPDAD